MIFEYVKDKKNRKIGVLAARNKLCIGWSACMTKKDQFDKTMGLKIATGRTYKTNVDIPHKLRKPYIKFLDRVKRYYK